MKTGFLLLCGVLVAHSVWAGSETNTVPLAAEPLIAYLESELSYTNEAAVELKIQKIHKQMELLDQVTNAQSPLLWQYRHDKLEYFLGCLYLEAGNRRLAYQHLKACTWNCGRYDIRARRIIETQFKTEDSNKTPALVPPEDAPSAPPGVR